MKHQLDGVFGEDRLGIVTSFVHLHTQESHHEMRMPERDVTYMVLSVY